MVLDNKERQWKHHSCGVFTNPVNRTAFDFKEEYKEFLTGFEKCNQ